MDLTGRINNISLDYKTNNTLVTFLIHEGSVKKLDELSGDTLTISLSKHRQKRSLNANSYFHLLVGRLAEKMEISAPRCKNILIGRYGQPWLDDGDLVTMWLKADVSDVLESETVHLWPIGYRFEQGHDETQYVLMRPSHEYDTAEMSRLIDGVVAECNDLGIETLPPEQIARMMSLWKA